MRKVKHILLAFTLASIFSACSERKASNSTDTVVPYKHARLLKRIDHDGYTTIEVKNPWDTTSILKKYIIARNGNAPHAENGEVTINVPLQRSVIYASPHCALIDELGAYGAIAGVCDLKYINMEKIRSDCRDGKIADLGNGMDPDMERLIDLHPDALLISPFENSSGHGQAEQLGIPIIECADYLEQTPLGRSEWIKFYGLLFGKETEADSLYSDIERKYLETKKSMSGTHKAKKVLCGLKAGAAWYIPGGKSLTATLISDAGGDYAFADDPHEHAIPLPFETVFDRACDADIWFFTYNQHDEMTYESMRRDNPAYAKFKAYEERNVFGCNTRYSLFYEEMPYHPELMLAELASLLSDNAKESTSRLRYYKPLSE